MSDLHLPMRWADLDVLNHVNNVVYVDYAMEARARLVEAGEVDSGAVCRVTVDFLRPLLLTSKPVLVRSEHGDGLDAHEIRSHDGETLHARVVVEPGESRPSIDAAGREFSMQVRRSDVGASGAVTVTKLFELFQEVRILGFAQTFPQRAAGRFVVGRVEIELGEPLVWQAEPYAVQTHVSHVSRSSFGSTARIEGGRFGAATATLVGFDLDTQTSRVLDDAEREALHVSMV